MAIATLLTQNPQLLLLDEPNSHLDVKYQIRLLSLLCEMAKQNQGAIIMNIHDVNLASRYCSHALLLLGNGETIQGELADVINSENLERLFQHPVEEISGQHGKIYVPG